MLEIRPSPEFSYDAGRNKLLDLHFFADGTSEVSFSTPGVYDPYDKYEDAADSGYTRRQGQMLRLSALVDLESRLTIGCVAALLAYVARRKAIENLSNDGEARNSFHISALEMFSLKNTM